MTDGGKAMRILTAAALACALAACGAQNGQAQTNAQGAVAFLAQNALAEGVHTTPSGLQYKILKSGPADGPHPTPDSYATVNYEGSLTNGQVFDSSYQRGKPETFQVGGLVPGWVEALQMMRPGDQWMIWTPPNLGYGSKQAGPIPPNSVLQFKMELISISATGPSQ